MPEYKFHDKVGKKKFLMTMSISERTQFLESNPHIEQLVHGAPMIGYNTNTRKIDSGFKDVLKEVKRKHRRSTIDTH
jgi:hypothetical protein